ncbi:MAG: RagB/SusD family nutrient uptake outer membrane protein [Gemmatimonadaceae bacterium]
MNIPVRKSLIGALVLLVGAGCTDLTVQPKSTVSSANIFNEPGSYRLFLAKLYGGLAVTGQEGPAGSGDIAGIDEGFSHYLRLWWQMEELPTDEAAIAWNDAGVQELNTQLWSSSNQFLVAMYYRIFFQVSLANEFLRETTDAKLAGRGVSGPLATDIAQYRAEARYLRALSYWHAVDLFGSVPLIDENFALGKTPPKQASRTEVFDFVVSELTAIRAQLPAAGAAQYGRVDQGAVAALLAEVYLNAGVYTGTDRYADARAEAEKVIAGPYQLESNYLKSFLADNNTSKEIIWSVPQDGINTRSYGGTTFLTHAAVGGGMDARKYGIGGGWWGLRLRPEVYNLYPGGATGPDKRASYFYVQTVSIGSLTDFTQGVAAPKYQNVTSAGRPGSNGDFADTDYPMFRLADAYLIYAEAVLRGGGGSRATALGYVNALRQRAYGGASGNITDAQLTLDFILDERARELLWEGHRRSDLIRYGRFTTAGIWQWKGGVQPGKVTESFRNLYPLPASELLANTNLKQNPGY